MSGPLRAPRRQVVHGAAVLGVGSPLLVACAGDDGGTGGGSASGVITGTGTVIRCGCHGSGFSTEDGSIVNGPAPAPLEEKSVTVDGDRITVEGSDLAASADVPVGGGAIFTDQQVVVTQPSEGDFKAFTAICTHQGCVVSNVEES